RPPYSLRNRRLGSVPAYTAPSTALTATENTAASGNPQSTQLRPPSTLRRTPPARNPAYTASPSTARHCAPLSDRDRSTPQPSPVSSIRTTPSPVAPYKRAITSAYALANAPQRLQAR